MQENIPNNKQDQITIHSSDFSSPQVLSSTTKLQKTKENKNDNIKTVSFKVTEKPNETDPSIPIPTSTSTKRLFAHSGFNPSHTANTIEHSNLNVSNEINISNITSKHTNLLTKQAYCLVWTPIPMISLLVPFYGHAGITNSIGTIYDFGSSKYVSVNQMTFGKPYKYIPLMPSSREKQIWDGSILKIAKRFSRKEYTLCGKNGYKFCAAVLNQVGFNDRNNYQQRDVIKMCFGWKYYVSFWAYLKTYLGWFAILLIIIIVLINVLL